MVSFIEFGVEMGLLGLCVGGKWSEVDVGINGMGICLVVVVLIFVCCEDYFYMQFIGFICLVVLVFDFFGNIVVVFDVISWFSMMQQYLLVLFGMMVCMIENCLIDCCFCDVYLLYFYSWLEFVYMLYEGKLVVSGDGSIFVVNCSVLFQLGLQMIDEICMWCVEDLFQSLLEDML